MTGISECCRAGFLWNGTPSGKETRIGDLDVYVAGENKQNAILFCHDGWGWQLNNNRLLVDHFAKEVGATVYMPDFFHGTAVPASQLEDGLENYDWATWIKTNNVDARMSEITTFAQHLRSEQKHTRVFAVGYCWGGRVALRLNKLVDAISIAHPSFVTEQEIKDVEVPVQILAPEEDPQFTPELKNLSFKVLLQKGLEFDWQYFPGLQHGFATRCDEKNETERRALERAKGAVVQWFGNFASSE